MVDANVCLSERRDLCEVLDRLCKIYGVKASLPFSQTMPFHTPVIGYLLNATQPGTRGSLTSELMQSVYTSQVLDTLDAYQYNYDGR